MLQSKDLVSEKIMSLNCSKLLVFLSVLVLSFTFLAGTGIAIETGADLTGYNVEKADSYHKNISSVSEFPDTWTSNEKYLIEAGTYDFSTQDVMVESENVTIHVEDGVTLKYTGNSEDLDDGFVSLRGNNTTLVSLNPQGATISHEPSAGWYPAVDIQGTGAELTGFNLETTRGTGGSEVVAIRASEVSVEHNKIQTDDEAGIKITNPWEPDHPWTYNEADDNTENVTVTNNLVAGTDNGLVVTNVMENETVDTNDDGEKEDYEYYQGTVKNLDVVNNTIDNNKKGVWMTTEEAGGTTRDAGTPQNVIFSGNEIKNNPIGIQFEALGDAEGFDTGQVTVEGNLITGSTDMTGIQINATDVTDNGEGLEVIDNEFTNQGDNSTDENLALHISADNVTGVNFRNNTVTGYRGGVFADKAYTNNLTVINNTFLIPIVKESDTKYYGYGVQLWHGNNLVVKDNKFTGSIDQGDPDVYTNSSVQYNHYGAVSWTSFFVGDFGQIKGGVQITDNEIKNLYLGTSAFSSAGEIRNNNIHDNYIGIQVGQIDDVYATAAAQGLAIEENDIVNNTRGIWVQNFVKDGMHASHNNIVGNTEYGIKNEDNDTFDATHNYWGAASGPEHKDNTYLAPDESEQGDSVSDNVTFTPWLNDSYPEGSALAPVKRYSEYTLYEDFGSPDSLHSSIQAAVDTGNTKAISTEPGVFEESVRIDVQGLALLSEEPQKSIITYEGVDTTATVDIRSEDVTLGRFKILRKNPDQWGQAVSVRDSGVRVEDNMIIGENMPANASQGIMVIDPNNGGITENVTVQNNTVRGFSDGVMVTTGYGGNVKNVSVSKNTLEENILGLILKVHKGENSPEDITVEKNKILENQVGVVGTGGEIDNYGGFRLDEFNGTEASISQNEIYNNTDFGVIHLGNGSLDATFNYWGNETGPSRLVNGEWIGDGGNITGKVEFIPWYPTMEAKEAVNKVSDSSMKAPAGDSNISVGGNNVSIDFSESAKTKTENGEEVTEVNTTGNLKVTGLGNESMEIPGNTTIKGENWDGKIKAPETKSEPTVNPDPSPGFTVQTGKTIQVGSEKTSLEFSNAVRLVIPDEAGKKAGYIRPGDEEVTKIGMTCDENSQTWADSNLNLSTSEGECYTDAENGEDLVIWTKHFTEFLVYEETQVQEDTETDSGGSITVCEEGDWNCTEWSECTDGIETRECEKTVSCGDFYDRAPAETQSCPMEVAQECPTCPAPSEWSECTDGTESRTNYRCGEGTDFECTEYTEQRQCEEVEAEVLEGSVGETEGPTGFLVQERTGFIAGIISLVVIAGTLMYWRMTE